MAKTKKSSKSKKIPSPKKEIYQTPQQKESQKKREELAKKWIEENQVKQKAVQSQEKIQRNEMIQKYREIEANLERDLDFYSEDDEHQVWKYPLIGVNLTIKRVKEDLRKKQRPGNQYTKLSPSKSSPSAIISPAKSIQNTPTKEQKLSPAKIDLPKPNFDDFKIKSKNLSHASKSLFHSPSSSSSDSLKNPFQDNFKRINYSPIKISPENEQFLKRSKVEEPSDITIVLNLN